MGGFPMTAAEIAAKLGDAHREGHDWRCRCPIHGGCSLALRDGRSALLVKCWAGCDTRDVLAELRCMGLLAGCGDGPRHVSVTVRSDDRRDGERRIEIAHRIWTGAKDPCGSPVARYLAGRGIAILPPPSLRWAPSLRRPDGASGPAMVARVDGPDGELVGVQRTWLDRDNCGQWHRRDRASLGPIAGGGVRLAPAAETLLIGEGVETALAAMQNDSATGVGGALDWRARGVGAAGGGAHSDHPRR
jgi:hypothetical protein